MTEQEWLGEGYCLIEACIKMARTYSYGGGCGIEIFGLAPKDARINNAAKETTGSVSFMELYSMVTLKCHCVKVRAGKGQMYILFKG